MNSGPAMGEDTSIRRLRKVMEVRARPEEVFRWLDDPLNTGSHMRGGSMGVKLTMETLSKNRTGVGATHRWHGKAMAFTVDYTTVVTDWERNREKAYHTVGDPKMVIMSGFEMRWTLDPTDPGTRVTIELGYHPPRSWIGRFLSTIVGRRYGDWCLNMMLGDARKDLAAFPSTAA